MACNCRKTKCVTSQGGGDVCTRCGGTGYYCFTHDDEAMDYDVDCCGKCEEVVESQTAGSMLASMLKGDGEFSGDDLLQQVKKQLPPGTKVSIG